MKRVIFATLISIAAAFSATAMAQGYIGVAAGQSDFKVDCSGTSSCDTNDTGGKVYGGFMYTPNFGVEISYFDLGKAKAAGTDPDLGIYSGSVKTDGFGLFAVALAPIDNFSVFAKLGIASTKTKIDVSSSLLGSDSESKRQTDFAWGLGAGYEFTKNFGARLEFERFRIKLADEKKDADFVSLGVTYRF